MDLRGKLETAWEWIKDQANETSTMIVITFGLGIIGGLSGNFVLITLALLSAFRWGQLDSTEIICDECGENLEEPYETSRDHTEIHRNTIDLLRSKEK